MKTRTAFLLPLVGTVACAAILSGCATTTIYDTAGHPLFRTQADMSTAEYTRAADGSVRWNAAGIKHSTATLAGGTAVTKGILGSGTAIATSGLPALVK